MDWSEIKQVREMAKQYSGDWDFVGIRIQTSDYGAKVGERIDHQSNEWDDGNMLDTTLDGVCAIDIAASNSVFENYGGYDGDYAIILGSNHVYGGNDPGEIIMRDAPVVLEIVHISQL